MNGLRDKEMNGLRDEDLFRHAIAYFDQRRSDVDPEKSFYEAAAEQDWVTVGGERVHLRSYLERFLFPVPQQIGLGPHHQSPQAPEQFPLLRHHRPIGFDAEQNQVGRAHHRHQGGARARGAARSGG